MALPKVAESLSKQQPQRVDLDVPTAYRAWAHWCAKLDGGGYQVKHAKWLENLEMETRVDILCEVLARATFETALGLHFDRIDSRVDTAVEEQISTMFGAAMLANVRSRVSACGPLMVRK